VIEPDLEDAVGDELLDTVLGVPAGVIVLADP
jgi:hypothetical protein